MSALRKPDLSDAEAASLVGRAVLHLDDFAPLAPGERCRPVLAVGAREAALVELLRDEPVVAYPCAMHAVYVLAGQVRYLTYDSQTLRPSEGAVLAPGEPLVIPQGVVRSLSSYADDRCIVLSLVFGEDRVCTEVGVPVPPDAAPQLADYYYEYDDCYRTVYEAGAELWETADPNDALVSIVEEFGHSLGSKWIDLGCGEGRDSVYLARLGYEVTGVDVSRAALRKARTRARREGLTCAFFERDVVHLRGVPPETFDVAINMGCLHMLNDPEHRFRHLRRVREILKPQGYFVVAHCAKEWLKGFYSVPDYARVGPAVTGRVIPRRIRLKQGGESWVDLPTTHFKEADEEELASEFASAGLKVTQWRSDENEAFGNTAVLVARKAGS